MNIALEIYQWVLANCKDLIQVYLQVIGIASLVVKLTPTLKDDDVLKNIIRFLGKYIALNRK